MDYPIEKAKTIFDLIRVVSPYAYPLLIALLFPIIWTLFKIVLGIRSGDTPLPAIEGNFFAKTWIRFRRAFMVADQNDNRIVFYFCVALFFAGGIILKIGEHKEELIRQKALALKKLCDRNNFLFYYKDKLENEQYSNDEIQSILYSYPDEFIQDGNLIICVDSTVKANVTTRVFRLLDNFLTKRLQDSSTVSMRELWKDDFMHSDNIHNILSPDIVYLFLSTEKAQEKYSIYAGDATTYIMRK